MTETNPFEPGSVGTDGAPDPVASIAISLKRIADVMQGGSDKYARSMNATLSEIAQHMVHLVAKK